MSENNHTKGEWSVGYTNVYSEKGKLIASTCPDGFYEGCGDVPNHAEREANARLIAATPDLLEACEAVIQQLTSDKFPIKILPDVEPFSIKLVRKAIAKAKGGK